MAAAASSSAASSSGYNVIGQGSFGRVIAPAFPNQGQAFPKHITKLYYDKKEYEDAIRHSKMVKQVMGNNQGFEVYPYHTTYSARQVQPSGLLRGIERKLQIQSINDPLFLLRMPDLGYSLNTVPKNPDRIKQLRECPIGMLMFQMNKLILQLKNLNDHGYVHGDLRETNLMYNMHQKTYTIIDFDWLKPSSNFVETYMPHFGFYSNPPESLLLPAITLLPQVAVPVHPIAVHGANHVELYRTTLDGSHSETNPVIQWYAAQHLKNFGAYYRAQQMDTLQEVSKYIEYSIVANAAYLTHLWNDPVLAAMNDDDRGMYIVVNRMMPYFDSYGLAMSLLSTFIYVYPGIMNAEQDRKAFHDQIVPVLKTAGHYYSTEEHWKIVSSALCDLGILLRQMATPLLEHRPHPARCVEIIQQIHEQWLQGIQAAQAEKNAEVAARSVSSHANPAPSSNLMNAMRSMQPINLSTSSHGGRRTLARKASKNTKSKKHQYTQRRHIRR